MLAVILFPLQESKGVEPVLDLSKQHTILYREEEMVRGRCQVKKKKKQEPQKQRGMEKALLRQGGKNGFKRESKSYSNVVISTSLPTPPYANNQETGPLS